MLCGMGCWWLWKSASALRACCWCDGGADGSAAMCCMGCVNSCARVVNRGVCVMMMLP